MYIMILIHVRPPKKDPNLFQCGSAGVVYCCWCKSFLYTVINFLCRRMILGPINVPLLGKSRSFGLP